MVLHSGKLMLGLLRQLVASSSSAREKETESEREKEKEKQTQKELEAERGRERERERERELDEKSKVVRGKHCRTDHTNQSNPSPHLQSPTHTCPDQNHHSAPQPS